MKKLNFLLLMSLIFGALVFNSCDDDTDPDINEEEEGSVTDIDDNVYRTVIIGDQEWFAENLRTTQYNDGTAIPTGHSDDEWAALTTGAYAIYLYTSINGLNSEAQVLDAYGALYNWYAVETGKLCPKGWHVPTDAEWTALTTYLGQNPGSKLKSSRTESDAHPRWNGSNTGVTDEYGFSALPGGLRLYGNNGNGAFYNVGDYGFFWSSTGYDALRAWSRLLSYDNSNVSPYYDDKRYGFSIRCIRNK